MMLAFLVGSYLLPKELERRKLDPSHSDWLIFLGILGTLIGAKVFFIFEIWDQIFIDIPGYDGKYALCADGGRAHPDLPGDGELRGGERPGGHSKEGQT
jgi:phosphatidylglycerol:prolipoprotein diacylglycerol transferase